MLAAYLIGQLPAGALADKHGGAKVLLSGLALWSAATALTALGAGGGGTGGGGGGGGSLAAVYASRVLLGLASACAMPAVAAAVAAWVPRGRRAGCVSIIYALFNIGRAVRVCVCVCVHVFACAFVCVCGYFGVGRCPKPAAAALLPADTVL
jgi:ACS family sodium-dependent inorganic phosphate cotransporter